MIGIERVRSSPRSSSATCHPSSPGIITSRRITSGSSLRAFSRPVGPSPASSTSIFSASRLTRQRSRIGGSSSMTRTLITVMTSSAYTRSSLAHSRSLRLPGERQDKHEARSPLRAWTNPDPPTHRPEELLGDEEAEAGASAHEVASCRLCPVELAEDQRALRLGDADPLVVHAHLYPVVASPRGDGHGAAVG